MPAFRHVCIRLLLLAALPLALARPARASAETSARWHTFTILNGLAGDTVQAIWEDPRGRIWFGTENGACSYDGARWQIYRTADGLVDNNVWSISGDADNTWFATSSGLTRLFRGQWERFSTADGLPSNDVRAVLVARDGTV